MVYTHYVCIFLKANESYKDDKKRHVGAGTVISLLKTVRQTSQPSHTAPVLSNFLHLTFVHFSYLII